MKVVVACEFSGIVRDAFAKRGHDACSIDLLPSESEGKHFQQDAMEFPREFWEQFDLAICHPPCRYLATSGARWFKERQKEQQEALEFVRYLMDLPVPRIALENPVSVISTRIRKPDQIINPYQFGHPDKKRTCLWLKNLPLLEPTDVVAQEHRVSRIQMMPDSKDRWKRRSRTFSGIADAMADQWGMLKGD